MENIKELFGTMIEHEIKESVAAAETMKDVWGLIRDRQDPFSAAVRDVILERMMDVRKTTKNILQFHRKVFDATKLSGQEDDQLITFLASQEKQARIAEEILRDDLKISAEPN